MQSQLHSLFEIRQKAPDMMQRNIFLLILAFFSLSCCSKDESTDYDDFEGLQEVESIDPVAKQTAIQACLQSVNQGKTVGVFGGSLASNPESAAAKMLWNKYLGMLVKTYGQQGHGFSSLQGSIQDQVKRAGRHDIYILWCSTNDYTTDREIGLPTDYTVADGYDERKLVTQCGGMNFCIRQLRTINPRATIYVFGSLKFFSSTDGYTTDSKRTNGLGYQYTDYIRAQRQVAEAQGLQFFDQWNIPILREENVERFYTSDKTHMSVEGYGNIGIYQLYFLATEQGMNISF